MMYVKMDVYQILERRKGAIFRTKKVAYHWFQMGRSPEPYATLDQGLVRQNGLPEGEYYYASTTDVVQDVRIPQGGLYK